ncbi:hypothetical protein DIPPA_33234 [Diplonema papillatum]|nr:hypothetical protein DIPPA_33234 [Diplonema papillatum]
MPQEDGLQASPVHDEDEESSDFSLQNPPELRPRGSSPVGSFESDVPSVVRSESRCPSFGFVGMRDLWLAFGWCACVVVVVWVAGRKMAVGDVYFADTADKAFTFLAATNDACWMGDELTVNATGECTSIGSPIGWTMAACEGGHVLLGRLLGSEEECRQHYCDTTALAKDPSTIWIPTSSFGGRAPEPPCQYGQFSLYDHVQLRSAPCMLRDRLAPLRKAVKLAAGGVLASTVAAVGFLYALRRFPRGSAIAASAAVSISFACLSVIFVPSRPGVSVLYGTSCVLVLVLLYTSRHKLAFAVDCAACAVSVALSRRGIVAHALCWVAGQAAFALLWACAVGSENSLIAVRHGALVPFMLSFFWTIQVCRNVVHVSMAAVTFTYLADNTTPTNERDDDPNQQAGSLPSLSTPPQSNDPLGTELLQQTPQSAFPVNDACRRACFNSLGSICFGSITVTFVSSAHAFVQVLCGADLPFCQEMAFSLLRALEGLTRSCNSGAYITIAQQDLPFVAASRSAWDSRRRASAAALESESLVGQVCVLFGLLGGLFTGLAIFIASDDTWAWFVVGFFGGFLSVSIFMRLISSGSCTIFVHFQQNPALTRGVLPRALRDAPFSEMAARVSAGISDDTSELSV